MIKLLIPNHTITDEIIQVNLEKLKIYLNYFVLRYNYTNQGFFCEQEGSHLLVMRKRL